MIIAQRPPVLFLINSFCGGGAERIMSILLSRSEHKSGQYEIHLALLDKEPVTYPIPSWVTLHQLDCHFRLPSSLVQVRGLIRELKPAITVSFLTRANVAGCAAMRNTGRPAIISERINTDMQLGSGFRGLITKAIVRLAYPRASRVIAVANGVADTLACNYGVERTRLEVVANPVDVEEIRRRAAEPVDQAIDGPFTFAMGRLVPNKNFPLLLRAFAKSGIPGRLVIAGEGQERAGLLALARSLEIQDRLSLPGFLDNPHSLLARAQTFVLSSNAEGFPNSLVEAISLGVPSIATNCPDGPAEILTGMDRQSIVGTRVAPAGILVPMNDVDALSDALVAAQDPDTRQRLSEEGPRLAGTYCVDSAVARYWEIIEQELAEVRTPERA
jgi:N-acetylgalactosamine-N,N'-diacetylbacillosaminyl-diphospho-undecaprenol 4-alpha-N-acetylgalactosaminyltransferase